MIEKSPKTEINQPSIGRTTDRTTTDVAAKTRASRLFEVEIAGVPLRLKSAHDDSTVNELVAMVDRKVKEALPLTKTGSIQNASILASLHLAEEYLTFKRKAKAELERLESKTLKVISELESSRITGLQSKDDRAKGFTNDTAPTTVLLTNELVGDSHLDTVAGDSLGKPGPALEA